MTFVTITTWELLSGVDFAVTLENVKKRRLPALIQLGATRVQVLRTSDRTFAAISEWPDQATRDAAAKAIEAVRQKVRAEDQTRMTGEMLGAVVAEA